MRTQKTNNTECNNVHILFDLAREKTHIPRPRASRQLQHTSRVLKLQHPSRVPPRQDKMLGCKGQIDLEGRACTNVTGMSLHRIQLKDLQSRDWQDEHLAQASGPDPAFSGWSFLSNNGQRSRYGRSLVYVYDDGLYVSDTKQLIFQYSSQANNREDLFLHPGSAVCIREDAAEYIFAGVVDGPCTVVADDSTFRILQAPLRRYDITGFACGRQGGGAGSCAFQKGVFNYLQLTPPNKTFCGYYQHDVSTSTPKWLQGEPRTLFAAL